MRRDLQRETEEGERNNAQVLEHKCVYTVECLIAFLHTTIYTKLDIRPEGIETKHLSQLGISPGCGYTLLGCKEEHQNYLVPKAGNAGNPSHFISLANVFIPRLIVNISSRKIPGLNVYAQMQNEKEQEMIPSPVSPTESTLVSPNTPRELVTSPELMDTELNTRPIGE